MFKVNGTLIFIIKIGCKNKSIKKNQVWNPRCSAHTIYQPWIPNACITQVLSQGPDTLWTSFRSDDL